jgi:hypothetical protein
MMMANRAFGAGLLLLLLGCSSTSVVEQDGSSGAGGEGAGGQAPGSGGAAGDEGGGMGGAGNGGAANGGGGASSAEPCSLYCQRVMTNCASTPQFPDNESCVATCATWPAGDANAQSGNSLSCRLYHATVAQASPALHCPHAGPAGVGTCGTNCESYCSVMLKTCAGAYEDVNVCLSECSTMTGANETRFTSGGAGDTLQCRIYHATFAAAGNAATHCPHAGPLPVLPCAPPQ